MPKPQPGHPRAEERSWREPYPGRLRAEQIGVPGTGAPGDRLQFYPAEEHLVRAQSLFQRWTDALDSSRYTLASLARGFEARLLAQVDALERTDPALLEQLPDALLQLLRPEGSEAVREAAPTLETEPARLILRSARAQPDALVEPMLVAALFGAPAQRASLVPAVALPDQRHAALFALGYTGELSVVPVLLSQLARPDVRAQKLAAEAISTLTGLDTTAAPYVRLPRPEDDLLPLLGLDRERNSIPSAVDSLPLPHARAITAWWRAHGHTLAEAPRVLLGVPWTPELVLRALEILPLRRRHALATWLEGQSGGRVQIDTRALCRTQVKQLAQARAFLTSSVV
jgi:hypothetical protein